MTTAAVRAIFWNLRRVFNKLIKEGKIPPPKRDLDFGGRTKFIRNIEYIRTHPGSEKMMLANLHQDMTGRKQSMGSRVQHLIYNAAFADLLSGRAI